jgi:hypothetical protein
MEPCRHDIEVGDYVAILKDGRKFTGSVLEEIQNFIDFINSGKPFTITDVSTRALYLANKYKFSINSFWEYIMYRTGKWIKK